MLNEITVKVFRNRLTVSSIQVAERFEKRHCDVLRLLNAKLRSVNGVRLSKHFFKSGYKDETGKENLMYLMDRDGFSFLVMSFTGIKADKWKLDFIDAFNAMEKQLQEQKSRLMEDMQKKLSDYSSKIEQLQDECNKQLDFMAKQKEAADEWTIKALKLSAFKDCVFAYAIEKGNVPLELLDNILFKTKLLNFERR